MAEIKKKNLFLFTVNYPFSQGEHLLEFELKHLAVEFDSVTIVCSDLESPQKFILPVESKILRYRPQLSLFDKLFAFKYFFHQLVWKEFIIVKKLKIPITIKLITQIIYSFALGKKSKKFFDKLNSDYSSSNNYFYSWWTTDSTLGFSLLRKNKNIIAVSRARAIDVYFERHNPAYLPFRKLIYDNLDAVFCISDEGKNYICDKFKSIGISSEKVLISRMGVVNRFGNVNNKFKSGVFQIVSCSNIIPLKRIHLIIEALSKTDGFSIMWRHFGAGPLDSQMEKLATDLLRDKPVKFSFEGYKNNNELMNFYNSNYVDLFINVSEYEGVPVSIMEAFSFGIPAIATNVGGVAELVSSESGYLLDVNVSSDQIANCIKVFCNLARYEQNALRFKAKETWFNFYNADRNFENIAKIISQL